VTEKNVVFINKPGQPLEVDICAIPDWDGFDKLIQFMINEYAAKVVNSFDGPDARRWILKAEGQEFELQHEDVYGNTLIATTTGSESIVNKIGLALENRLNE
jgi:hypothetical protein